MSASKASVSQSSSKDQTAPSVSVVRSGSTLAGLLGNQQLQRLLLSRRLQAKLTVSHPNDVYEQEADAVAERIMRMPESEPEVSAVAPKVVQRVCSSCEEELMRFEDSAGGVPVVDAALENSIGSLAGRGEPLPASVRSFLEPRFGADFSAVRVHTDRHAQLLARSVNAQAFTVGRDVVFGAGQYAPETDRGKQLLAHELTHTLQQGHVVAANAPARGAALQRQPDTAPKEGAGENETGRITKIIFDKPAHQATFYLDDHGEEHAVTQTVTDHCEPVQGLYKTTVVPSAKRPGGLDWKVPEGVCTAGKGFVLRIDHPRFPGTLEGATAVEFEVIGDAVGKFLTASAAPSSVSLDPQTRLRIAEKLLEAGVSEDDLYDYGKNGSRPAQSGAEFEKSVDRFLEQRRVVRDARLAEVGALTGAMTFAPGVAGQSGSGSGLDGTMFDIYEDYRRLNGPFSGLKSQFNLRMREEYDRLEQAHDLDGPTDELYRLRRNAMEKSLRQGLRTSIETRLQERYGISGIPEFEGRIAAFELAFRKATAGLALTALDGALSMCGRYLSEVRAVETTRLFNEKGKQIIHGLDPVRPAVEARLERRDQQSKKALAAMAKALRLGGSDAAYTAAHEAKAEADAARKAADATLNVVPFALQRFPFVAWPDFPREKLVHMTDPSDVMYLVDWYLADHITSMLKAREQLEDSRRVYKFDSLLLAAKKRFSIADGSIFAGIVGNEVDLESQQSVLEKLETAVLVALIVTSVLVPGSALVTTAIAGIGAHQAGKLYMEYAEDHAAYQAGLKSTDPSQLWVVVALLGVGMDLKGALELVDKLPALRKAVEEFGQTRQVERLADELDRIKELDQKAREAIKEDAQGQVAESTSGGGHGGDVTQSEEAVDVVKLPESHVDAQERARNVADSSRHVDNPSARQLRDEIDEVMAHPENMERVDGHLQERLGNHTWKQEGGMWCRHSTRKCVILGPGPDNAISGEINTPHRLGHVDPALDEVVAQSHQAVSEALDDMQIVRPPGVADHLSPECMRGACGFASGDVANRLRNSGIPADRIFVNQAARIAGSSEGAWHQFVVYEGADGINVLVDTTFAQFTDSDNPLVQRLLASEAGSRLRADLLEKGYTVLTDDVANLYMQVVSDGQAVRTVQVGDFKHPSANLGENPALVPPRHNLQ